MIKNICFDKTNQKLIVYSTKVEKPVEFHIIESNSETKFLTKYKNGEYLIETNCFDELFNGDISEELMIQLYHEPLHYAENIIHPHWVAGEEGFHEFILDLDKIDGQNNIISQIYKQLKDSKTLANLLEDVVSAHYLKRWFDWEFIAKAMGAIQTIEFVEKGLLPLLSQFVTPFDIPRRKKGVSTNILNTLELTCLDRFIEVSKVNLLNDFFLSNLYYEDYEFIDLLTKNNKADKSKENLRKLSGENMIAFYTEFNLERCCNRRFKKSTDPYHAFRWAWEKERIILLKTLLNCPKFQKDRRFFKKHYSKVVNAVRRRFPEFVLL